MEQSNVFDSTPLMVPYLDAHLVIFLLDFLRDVSDVSCAGWPVKMLCINVSSCAACVVWCVQPTGHLSCKDSCGGKNQHDHGRGR